MFGKIIENLRLIYAPKVDVKYQPKGVDSVLENIAEEKKRIGILLDMEMIEEDDYLKKLQTLCNYETEVMEENNIVQLDIN